MPGRNGMGPCGRGLARGRGYGWREPVELSKEEQKKILEAQKEEIDKRLKEME